MALNYRSSASSFACAFTLGLLACAAGCSSTDETQTENVGQSRSMLEAGDSAAFSAHNARNFKDYNRDGRFDLLWHNSSTGELQAWFMNGTDRTGFNSIKEQSTQVPHSVLTPWSLVGSGDIDRDGSTDLLLSNSATGEIEAWFMIGTDRKGHNSLHEQSTGAPIRPAAGWAYRLLGDFNNDGNLDLLFQNQSTGDLQVWFMLGTDRIGFNVIREQSTQQPIRVSDAAWQFATTADMNQDGNLDIVIHNNNTGVIQAWFMLGTDRIGFNTVKEQSTQVEHRVVAPWSLAGSGTINGDASPDLILRNQTTGATQVWFMSGTDRTGFNDVKEQSTQKRLDVTAPWTLVVR